MERTAIRGKEQEVRTSVGRVRTAWCLLAALHSAAAADAGGAVARLGAGCMLSAGPLLWVAVG